MAKYSFDFKREIVSEYLRGDGSADYLSEKHNINNNGSQVQKWINQYEDFGDDGLKNRITKTNYSGEFKSSILQYRQIKKCTYREAANYFKIINPSIIVNWQCKYDEEGFEGLNRRIGRPSKMSDKKKKNL